jgi:hypothetical protein
MIGALVRNVELAIEIAPAIFVPLMLFSGYTNNTKNIVNWLKWLEHISPVRYAFEFFVTNEFQDKTNLGPANPIKTLNFDMGIQMTLGILVAIYFGLNVLSLIFVIMGAKKGAIN